MSLLTYLMGILWNVADPGDTLGKYCSWSIVNASTVNKIIVDDHLL